MTAEMADSERQRAEHGAEVDLGTLEVLELLSTGPLATTYLACARRDGRRVILRRGHPGAAARSALQREAATLARLHHPCLPELLGQGDTPEGPYLVVPYSPGPRLEQLVLRSGRGLGPGALLGLLLPLLDALQLLHEQGLLHGDISPRNILVRADGLPLLIDFGSLRPFPETPPDRAAGHWGTAGFAAPELAAGGQPVGPTADLYALAASLAWAVLRAGAAGGESGWQSSDSGRLAERLPEGLAACLAWPLHEAVEERPATAAAWAEALRAEAAEIDAGDDDGGRDGVAALAEAVAAIQGTEVLLPPQDELPPTEFMSGAAEAAMDDRSTARSAPVAAQHPAAARPRRGAGRWLSVVLLLALGAAAAGGWWAREQGLILPRMTWVVDAAGGGDVATIAAAIARAPDGATIEIRPGRYAESLEIGRALHLRGLEIEGARPLIAPETGGCVVLRAANASLSGLDFTGGDGTASCLLVATGNALLTGLTVEDWQGTALSVGGGATPTLRDLTLVKAGAVGMLLDEGAQATLLDSRIQRSARSGVELRGGAEATLTGNRIEASGGSGLLIVDGAMGRFEGNEIVGSRGSGIEVRGGGPTRRCGTTRSSTPSRPGCSSTKARAAPMRRTGSAGAASPAWWSTAAPTRGCATTRSATAPSTAS